MRAAPRALPPPERAVEFTHVHTSRSCRSNANPKNSSLSKSLYSAICSQEELTGLFRQVVDFRLIFETCESNSPERGRAAPKAPGGGPAFPQIQCLWRD